MKLLQKPWFLIGLVLIIDQVVKFYIKTHFALGESVQVAGNWFYLHFTENNGMAFGMEFAGSFGKLLLSLFRIVAVGLIGFYLYDLVRKQAHVGYIASIALIFAGAVGNIIDSIFYGVLFSDSFYRIAEFLPSEGGYASLLHGKVVDMFYFPLVEGHFPEWSPLWPGEQFIFFRPVFNVADAAISIGVIAIILFQKRFFQEEKKQVAESEKSQPVS